MAYHTTDTYTLKRETLAFSNRISKNSLDPTGSSTQT